jgi:hypothetical protein
LVLDAEKRNGHKHAERERSRGRERACWRFIAGNDRTEIRKRDEEEDCAQKADILLRITEADIFDLLFNRGDDDFQKVLPASMFQICRKVSRDCQRSLKTSHEGSNENQPL